MGYSQAGSLFRWKRMGQFAQLLRGFKWDGIEFNLLKAT